MLEAVAEDYFTNKKWRLFCSEWGKKTIKCQCNIQNCGSVWRRGNESQHKRPEVSDSLVKLVRYTQAFVAATMTAMDRHSRMGGGAWQHQVSHPAHKRNLRQHSQWHMTPPTRHTSLPTVRTTKNAATRSFPVWSLMSSWVKKTTAMTVVHAVLR